MLGASRIGPAALILPAKSHKEVIVAAVACRDKTKGSKYAKTHSIEKVYSGSDCYQRQLSVAFLVSCLPYAHNYLIVSLLELIDDPTIDVVYNAVRSSPVEQTLPYNVSTSQLPNALHYEWNMRALNSGKNVLSEKPMADTAEEVRKLIDTAEARGVVLLEAIHWRYILDTIILPRRLLNPTSVTAFIPRLSGSRR